MSENSTTPNADATSSADPNAPNTPGAAANFFLDGQRQKYIRNATSPKFEDPDPPSENATKEELQAYHHLTTEYCNEMIDSFEASDLKGENLWIEFTATFREHTVLQMTKTMLMRWVKLLVNGGVYVTRKKGYARTKALIECLDADDFPCQEITAESAEEDIPEETEERRCQVKSTPNDKKKGKNQTTNATKVEDGGVHMDSNETSDD